MTKDPDTLVHLTTAGTHVEAELLAEALRAEDIAAHVFQTGMDQLPAFGNPIAYTAVSVPRRDLERARALVQRFQERRAEDAPETLTPSAAFPSDLICATCGFSLVGLGAQARCPECGALIPPTQRPLLGTTKSDHPVAAGPVKRAQRPWRIRSGLVLAIALALVGVAGTGVLGGPLSVVVIPAGVVATCAVLWIAVRQGRP